MSLSIVYQKGYYVKGFLPYMICVVSIRAFDEIFRLKLKPNTEIRMLAASLRRMSSFEALHTATNSR